MGVAGAAASVPGGPAYTVGDATGDAVKFGTLWGLGVGAVAARGTAGPAATRAAAGARAGLAMTAGFVAASAAEAAGYGALTRRGWSDAGAQAATGVALAAVTGAGVAATLAGRLPRAAMPAFLGTGLIAACIGFSAATGGDDPLHHHSGFHDIDPG